jgi:hypothetical protein
MDLVSLYFTINGKTFAKLVHSIAPTPGRTFCPIHWEDLKKSHWSLKKNYFFEDILSEKEQLSFSMGLKKFRNKKITFF